MVNRKLTERRADQDTPAACAAPVVPVGAVSSRGHGAVFGTSATCGDCEFRSAYEARASVGRHFRRAESAPKPSSRGPVYGCGFFAPADAETCVRRLDSAILVVKAIEERRYAVTANRD